MLNIKDEDDFLHSSPQEKFCEILFNANRGVCEHEAVRLIKNIAVLEMMVEKELGIDSETLAKMIHSQILEDSMELHSKVETLYIESMGNVLTQAE